MVTQLNLMILLADSLILIHLNLKEMTEQNIQLKIVQDFLAPFILFMHNEYELSYTSMADELEQRQIKLNASSRKLFGKKELSLTRFEMEIDAGRIETFTVDTGKHSLLAKRIIREPV